MGKRSRDLEFIASVLRRRFGEEGVALMPQVKEVPNYGLLPSLFWALHDAATVEAARQAIAEARQTPPAGGDGNGL